MSSFKLYVAGVIATKVIVAAGFVAIAVTAKPYRDIELRLDAIKEEWLTSAARQSIKDRYAAGKCNRTQWLEGMHNGPAKLAWVELSTSFPGHQKYIAKRIREEFPHATKWV